MGAVDDFGCLAYASLLVLLFAAALICSGTAAGRTNIGTYIVKAANCDAEYFKHQNTTSRINSDWKLISRRGACMMSEVKCSLRRSFYSSCSVGYSDCIQFSGPSYRWKSMDKAALEEAYDSDFFEGAKRWYEASYLAVAGTVALYVAVIPWSILSYVNIFPLRFSYSLFLAVSMTFTSMVLWIASLANTVNTSQLDPASWKASFFKTCSVTIQEAEGFGLGIFIVIATGFVVLFTIVGYMIYRNGIFDVDGDARPISKSPEAFYHTVVVSSRQGIDRITTFFGLRSSTPPPQIPIYGPRGPQIPPGNAGFDEGAVELRPPPPPQQRRFVRIMGNGFI